MAASERIVVLLTVAKKKRIANLSKAAGLSMGEFMRRAVTAYRSLENERELDGMIDQMYKTTAQASSAVDRALAFVESSNRRIARMALGRRRFPD